MYSTVYVLWLVYFRIQRELAAYTALPKGAQSRRLFLQRSLTKERKADQDIVTRLVHEVGISEKYGNRFSKHTLLLP